MGRGSQENEHRGQLIYAKITGTKEGEKVHFELSRPNPDGGAIPDGTERDLSGHLAAAMHRVWTYQGRAIDSVVLFLEAPEAGEKGETYKIEVPLDGGLGRQIVNSLLSAENFLPPLKISLRNSKKNGYPNAYLSLGGEDLKWALSLDEQNAKISIEHKKEKDATGKIVDVEKKNYLELNEFLLKEFKEKIIPKVTARQKAAGKLPPVYDALKSDEFMDDTQPAQASAETPANEKMPWES
jgi:hypothetical protein